MKKSSSNPSWRSLTDSLKPECAIVDNESIKNIDELDLFYGSNATLAKCILSSDMFLTDDHFSAITENRPSSTEANMRITGFSQDTFTKLL